MSFVDRLKMIEGAYLEFITIQKYSILSFKLYLLGSEAVCVKTNVVKTLYFQREDDVLYRFHFRNLKIS